MKKSSEICIVENALMERMLAQNPRELFALFAEEERAYCFGRKGWERHLAVRFAAKKAVHTLLGARAEVQLNTVLVRKGGSGVPYLFLTGSAAERARALQLMHWSLSLSHTANYSAAFVVAEGLQGESSSST